MLDNGNLIDNQKAKAKAYMASNDPDGRLTYHSWRHVSNVITALEDMLPDFDFDPKHQEDLLLAAIWHDADYAKGKEGHEARSAAVAKESLKETGLEQERLDRIERLILSTQMAVAPEQEDEGLMKDADLSHLGSLGYMSFYDDLFKEINSNPEQAMTEAEWRKMCVEFSEKVKYYTAPAKKRYESIKQRNIAQLKKMAEITPVESENLGPTEELSKKEKKKLKKARKKNEPKFNAEKGIETMFRVSLRNHISLSQIADEKANTLISVNAIILSIVLSALFPKLDSNPWLLYPGISLILVSITTIIMATLSTIPKTTQGSVTEVDVKNKKGNLLFFGNFHKMSLKEYEWGMGELMKDEDYLYGSMTRDLYFLGLVLNRKYSLLRYGYFVFVIGLLISIALFVWSVVYMSPDGAL